MENKNIENTIERDIEVTHEEQQLDSTTGLSDLFLENSPEKLEDFFEQMDREKIAMYTAFYRDYDKYIEAVYRVNTYEMNLRWAHITMTVLGLASFGMTYLFGQQILELMTKSTVAKYSILSLLPMAVFNVLNSATLVLKYFYNDDA